MVYNTENTDWPEFFINAGSKDLISRFFLLLDTESPEVGDKLADEIFAPNARAEFGGKFFTGKEGNDFSVKTIPIINPFTEIRKSRDNAWKVISKRRHKVVKVFTANAQGDDLLVIGHVEMGFRNGNSLEGEFSGRITIEGPTSDTPKLLLYQVYAVSIRERTWRYV